MECVVKKVRQMKKEILLSIVAVAFLLTAYGSIHNNAKVVTKESVNEATEEELLLQTTAKVSEVQEKVGAITGAMETESVPEKEENAIEVIEEIQVESVQEAEETAEEVPEKIVDSEPPVINGVQEITVYLGDAISYKKGIKVNDNLDENVELTVDNSAVNRNAVGDYPVYYTAVDSAGNQASAQTVLHIVTKPEIKDADVWPLVDAVIAQVTTPEMSLWDKAYAIWEWCGTQIDYLAVEEKFSNEWEATYYGLQNRAGDCYVYYATYKIFMDRLGVPNLCVSRIKGESPHYWNLVNLGNGWYHSDCSPRRVGHVYKCFMQTDAQVQSYTDFYTERPNYYAFDTSAYPERGTEILFDGWQER